MDEVPDQATQDLADLVAEFLRPTERAALSGSTLQAVKIVERERGVPHEVLIGRKSRAAYFIPLRQGDGNGLLAAALISEYRFERGVPQRPAGWWRQARGAH